jgi:hypothetical protein
MPLLYQPVINANTKAAHVDINRGGLVLTDNLSNPTRNFHRIETATTFSLDDAVTAAPCDRSRVRSFSSRINANDERAIGFDLFPARFHHEVVRDEAVKARGHESLIRRQGILTFEQILATKLSDLATAPMDLLGIEAVQLGQLPNGSVFITSQNQQVSCARAPAGNPHWLNPTPEPGHVPVGRASKLSPRLVDGDPERR